MSRVRILTASLFLALFFTLPAHSLEIGGDDDNPFTVSYDEGPISVKPGEQVLFNVHFTIPEGHYLYADKMTIEVSGDVPHGELDKAPGVTKHDPFSNETLEVHYGEIDMSRLLTIPADKTGDLSVKGRIIFQGCSSELCYRVMKIPFEVAYVVGGKASGGSQAPTKTSGEGEPSGGGIWASLKTSVSQPDIAHLLGAKNYALTLLVAFLGGILSDLTPCVWPMIPVTMVIIGVRRDRSWGANLLAVSVMVLGMAFTYSLLGVASALLGKSLGFLFQQQFFLWILFAVMFLMGLSLLGLFEIRLPSRWLTWLSQVTASGYRGIFFVGATLGILAAPCVGPVIGAILVYVAQTQDAWLGFWLLLFYALGMGSLFILMGVLYRSFKIKSKTGTWTVIFKKLMGVAILLVSLYYGHVALGQFRQGGATDGFWVTSLSAGLEKAVREGKPVIVDFYADWCLPCKELDKNVWGDKAVREEIVKNFEAIHIDCTQDTEECRAAVERFKVIGWPTVVFLNRGLEESASDRLVGKVISAQEMLKILERVKSL